jgi:hypothetical protein
LIMSCCGDKRERIYPDPYAHARTSDGVPEGQSAYVPASSWFEYTGATAMTVKGAVTGQIYRFEGTGTKLEVDRRDAAYMAGVPRLRKVLNV